MAFLAAVAGSLATTVTAAPPAGAVPVDGVYTGTISNTVGGSSAALGVTLSTSGPNRDPVSASVTIGAGVTVQCAGTQAIPPTTMPLIFSGNGGTPSSAPQGTATLVVNGSTTASGFNIPIRIDATVSRDRNRVFGTATLTLPGFPLNCAPAILSFDAFSNRPYAIRTGHDGGPDVNGVDITHMIDREASSTVTPWERCMFLWATPPAGTPTPTSATWSIASGAPPGAHIKAGWGNGAPPGTPDDGTPFPLRTMVCITDATPRDTTFTVEIAPNGGGVTGRVLLWVGDNISYAGRAQGDVHNTTFDETPYDFQGVGEYVDAVAGGGKDFAVQSRLEAVPSAPVTVTTAIAARVDGDRIGLYLDASGAPQWYLDGKPLTVSATLPSGGEVTNPSPDHWRVTWPKTTTAPGATTGTTMQVSFARWAPMDHLNIDELVLGPGLQYSQVQGLLGVADRDPANDLTPSTGGNPVSADIDPATPAYAQPLYREFGRSWLVTTSGGPLDTLFDYLDPGHPDPASYENEHFPAERPSVVDGRARTVCLKAGVTAWPQIDFCTYDIEVTGAREIAEYYRDGWSPV